MSIHDRVRIYEWFSWSQWGMFREPLLTCPGWFAGGMTDIDDDDVEYLPDTSPPLVRAPQNIAERDPPVMPDSGGGGVTITSGIRKSES